MGPGYTLKAMPMAFNEKTNEIKGKGKGKNEKWR